MTTFMEFMTIECDDLTALFGIFLETNKHQNLLRLRCLIDLWPLEGSEVGVGRLQPRFVIDFGLAGLS